MGNYTASKTNDENQDTTHTESEYVSLCWKTSCQENTLTFIEMPLHAETTPAPVQDADMW